MALALVAGGVGQRSEQKAPTPPKASTSKTLAYAPVALQGAVSAALGGEQEQFSIDRSPRGLIARGGGVLTVFRPAGPNVVVGGARVAFALAGVGYGETLTSARWVRPVAAGNRVLYRRGGGVTEWYKNGPLGLEQGFTLRERPRAGTGPLTVALQLSGSLTASLRGSSLEFARNAGGPGVVRYGGLFATDAAGRELPALLELDGSTLLLRVEDGRAQYPVVIDPFIQQGAKLTAPAGEIGAGEFGYSVALSSDGTTALIGADEDNSGVGAAWVFLRSGAVWTQGPKLTGSGESGQGVFGTSVALSADGNTALIGGPGDNAFVGAAWVFTRTAGVWTQQGAKLTGSGATGLASFGGSVALSSNGDTALIGGYSDNDFVGAAWVFARSGSTWSQQGAKLTGGGEIADGDFGFSVALSADGNTALIGGESDNNFVGAAWVFTRSGSTWTQQGPKLTGSAEFGQGSFGFSVALSADGNTALIGGNSDNNFVGAAWAFIRSGSTWSQQGPKLTGTSVIGEGEFGFSVALSANGNSALISAPFSLAGNGAVWQYTRSGSTWTNQSGGGQTGGPGANAYGFAVALTSDGANVLVGAPGADGGVGAAWPAGPIVGSFWTPQGGRLTASAGGIGASRFARAVALSQDGNTGLIGSFADNNSVGAAWVFTRSGSVWGQQGAKLIGSGATGAASFGFSVALSADGNTALIGGTDDNGNRGAAWVFTRSGATWTQQGSKLTASGQVGSGGFFGSSVALSSNGNTALIGATADDNSRGAAWVFTRSGATWTQQGGKLTPNDAADAGFFGGSVALSADGNTALVGADGDGIPGAAWVFIRSGSTWAQQGSKLSGSGASGASGFGTGVALSSDGNTALIGGPGDDLGKGAAWVFTRSGAAWTQQGSKLTGAGMTGGGGFGSSVALSADGNSSLIGGSDDASGVGAAWVFTRSGSTWTQLGSKLTGSGEIGAGQFGRSLALSSDAYTALIGAYADNSLVGAAWVFAVPAPSEPTGVSALADDASATVRWSPPASDGGTPITGYVLTPFVGASAQTPTVVGAVTATTVGGLTNGTTYTFTVTATNDLRSGPASVASNAVTPTAQTRTAPEPPAAVPRPVVPDPPTLGGVRPPPPRQ